MIVHGWYMYSIKQSTKCRTDSMVPTEARCHTILQWRHTVHDGVSNHQPRGCLLNRLFRHISKKTSKLRVTGPLCGEFTVMKQNIQCTLDNSRLYCPRRTDNKFTLHVHEVRSNPLDVPRLFWYRCVQFPVFFPFVQPLMQSITEHKQHRVSLLNVLHSLLF